MRSSHTWLHFTLALLVSMLILLRSAPPSIAQDPSPPPLPVSAPVLLKGETLFEIKAQIASFSPTLRAQVISERIRSYARNDMESPLPLRVRNNDVTQTADIVAGETVLMTVAEVDAVAAGVPRPELAQQYVGIITERVREYRESYSLNRIVRGVIFAAIATLIFILLLLLLSRLTPWAKRRLRGWQGSRITSIKLFGKEILSAHRIVDIVLEFIKLGRLLLWLASIYLYLNLVLSFFPWTVGLSRQMFRYLALAVQGILNGFVNYLPNLFVLVLTIVLTAYVIKIVRFFFLELERGTMTMPGFYPEWAKPTAKLAQFLILMFAIIVAFPYLPGAQSPAFQGVSIFLGLLISLGSSSAISNVVSGTILTYTRAFKLGDRVKISDTVGDVVEKTLFVTRIQTIKNVVITIPNSSILSNHVINYSAAASDPTVPPLILSTTITLGYDVPWTQVHQVLVDAALATAQILSDPPPFVLQTSLDDFYVSYELNAFTLSPSIMAKIYSELHQNIQDYCNAADIEILSPHYRAVRDGNMTTIPAHYLDPTYQAPSFRVMHPPETQDNP